MAFGAWTMVKAVVFLLTHDLAMVLRSVDFQMDSGISVFAVYVVLALIMCIDLGVRAYVGLSARAEGLRRKRGRLYLIIAALAALANASSVFATVLGMASTLSPLDAVVSAAIDITSVAALVLVVVCSIRLRRLDPVTG